jgi:two-component system phosphate regulon sensor histidine kinase PhoR
MIKYRNKTWILLLSSLAIGLLIFFQARWMLQSKQLIEEQFEQKATMALCRAVEEVARTCAEGGPSLYNITLATCGQRCTLSAVDSAALAGALNRSLSFYGIDLPYAVELRPAATATAVAAAGAGPDRVSAPLLPREDLLLSISFQAKERYVIQRLGLMTAASIIILMMVGGLFLFTALSLVRQQRLNAMNIDFFNSIAHEFRTPLTNINLALRLLGRQEPAVAAHRYTSVIQKESRRLLTQVERVLQLARLERGEYRLQRQQVALRALVREVVDDMQVQITANNARLQLELGEEELSLAADPFHLGNAFRNLIDNALKYAGEQPLLRIRLYQQNERAVIEFGDNGNGISKGQQEDLFQPFHRCEAPPNGREDAGFGLGLAYVKKVVDLHGGAIRLISETGRGARFLLSFALNPQ